MIVGTTDKNCSFHPFGIAVCVNEQIDHFKFISSSVKQFCLNIMNFSYQPITLIGDGAAEITNVTTFTFNSLEKRVMCFFQV